jgi:hypothetical protein
VSEVYEVPLSELEQQLVAWAAEAVALRFDVVADGSSPPRLPEGVFGAHEVLEQLRVTRRRLDRIEGLLSRCTIAKARASRASVHARAEAEHAWDQSSQRERSRPAARGSDFTGPRERYADSNLATLAEQRSARSAASLASVAEEALDVVRIAHRGLNDMRADLHLMLRSLSVESTLER